MDLEIVKLCDLSHDHKYKYHRKLAFILSLPSNMKVESN